MDKKPQANVIAAQFKSKRATVLADMTGNTLELEDTISTPNFKKKIVSLSKLQNKVDEWTKSHLKISKTNKHIVIKCKENQPIFYWDKPKVNKMKLPWT